MLGAIVNMNDRLDANRDREHLIDRLDAQQRRIDGCRDAQVTLRSTRGDCDFPKDAPTDHAMHKSSPIGLIGSANKERRIDR